MSSPWYIARGKQKVGPHTYEEMRQMAASSQLLPSDMVLNEGSRQWVPAGDVPGLTFDSKKEEPKEVRGSKPGGWYFARNGQRFGPFAFEQFRQMAASGLLSADDMVQSDDGCWASAGTVSGLFGESPGIPLAKPVRQSETPAIPLAMPVRDGESPGIPLAMPVRPAPSLPPRNQARPVGGIPHASPPLGLPVASPVKARQEEQSAGTEPSPPRRSWFDIGLVMLTVASVLVWLLGLGGIWQCVAGLVFIGFGLRGVITGKAVDFNGLVSSHRSFRVGGVIVCVMGSCVLGTGVNDVIERTKKFTADQEAAARAHQEKAARAQGAIAAFNRGRQHVKDGESDQAILAYSESILLDPSHFGSFINRGLSYGRKGEYEKGIADFSQALQLMNNHPDKEWVAKVYISRGRCYLSMQNFDPAIADFTEGIRIQPALTEAYSLRSRAYSEKGDHARAKADSDVVELRKQTERQVKDKDKENLKGNITK